MVLSPSFGDRAGTALPPRGCSQSRDPVSTPRTVLAATLRSLIQHLSSLAPSKPFNSNTNTALPPPTSTRRWLDPVGLINLDLSKKKKTKLREGKKTPPTRPQSQCPVSHPLLLKTIRLQPRWMLGCRRLASCETDDLERSWKSWRGWRRPWKKRSGVEKGSGRVGRQKLLPGKSQLRLLHTARPNFQRKRGLGRLG